MHDTESMACPDCAVTLTAETVNGVQVDRCPDCGGVWLDSGEFEVLAADGDGGLAERIVSGLLSGDGTGGAKGSRHGGL